MELIQGCANKLELAKVQNFVNPFPLLWLSPEVSDDAITLYSQARLSHNLGLLDALIGQLALSLDVPIHTFNTKHLSSIPNLRTIQPYSR